MVRISINTMWCGSPNIADAFCERRAIKIFVQEHLPQIEHYHPDVTVQQWSVQVDHIYVVKEKVGSIKEFHSSLHKFYGKKNTIQRVKKGCGGGR